MAVGKILVIDDEPSICEGSRLALTEKEHHVDVCMNGKAGMNAIFKGNYDIVLLDLKLPDMDGMDVLRLARRENINAYVVVMTGYSTVQNAVEAMKLGAFDYLAKPFSDDELLLTIERALEKKLLIEENITLRKELLNHFRFDNIVGKNTYILNLFDKIKKVAPSESTVLIYGESGTGKELFAHAIHAHSNRATKKFVAVDCSTLSPGILESELFGHVKGAFTGAFRDKAGIFEVANGSTLFLDDIANLNIETQGKLLRVIEMHEYKPVGASQTRRTDVRIIAATNKNLKAMVKEGKFREDLFYRLNVFPLFLPPLRDRKDDIPNLAYHFLRHFSKKTGKRIEGFSDDAMEMLVNFDWPGNVRQLKNIVERLVIMAESEVLDLLYMTDHFYMKRSLQENSIPETLTELKAVKKHLLEETFGSIEKAFIIKALKACNGNISKAAEKVGMKRPNFFTLMKKHHLSATELKVP